MSGLAVKPDFLGVANPGCETEECGGVENRGEGFGAAARQSGVLRTIAMLICVHALETGLFLGSWICVGSGALSGRLDYGWLAAWALALASMVPLHAISTWLQGVIAMGFGGILKQRMLETALLADPHTGEVKGSGRALSEALDTVALDDLATNGGITAFLASIELLVAPALLYWGGGSLFEFTILVGWIVLTIALISHNLGLRSDWTQQRLALTHRLIDGMTAQQTRVAQQSPERWHEGEDAAVASYLRVSKSLDDSTACIETALPRIYLIVSFLALAPSFVSGTITADRLAVAVGVILFAKAALEQLCLGFSRPAAAWIAWRHAKPTTAGNTVQRAESAVFGGFPGFPVLQARELAFTYPDRTQPVLAKCNLCVDRGEHVLLEGSSGSGKSTLGNILAGLRAASAGYVLGGGVDHLTQGGPVWRQRVVLVPHDDRNHLFSASLLFNLLLGRPSPATVHEEAEAEELCRELGLATLLETMPEGIHQRVGDSGWELSQGERSRVFLARGILQRSEVLILDESFAALDPENLRRCLACIRRRTETIIVMTQG